MKKSISLLCAFVLAISFNSCSSSSDDSVGSSSDKIIGNWKFIGDIDESGFDPNTDEPCDDDFVKFNSNGTALSTDKICGEVTETSPATWENTGGGVYSFTETETGDSGTWSVEFSEDFKQMSIFPEGQTTFGIVYRKQ